MLSISFGRHQPEGSQPDPATATLAATLAAHIEQCKTDKAEIKQALIIQSNERRNMHEENQRRLRRLEMVYYFATAIIMVLGFMLTDTGQHIFGAVVHGQLLAIMGPVP